MGKQHTGGSAGRRASLAVPLVALALAAPAAASDSSKGSILSTYGGKSRPLVTITRGTHGKGGLPNTGLDVALVIAGGAGIGLLGLGLRRLARQTS